MHSLKVGIFKSNQVLTDPGIKYFMELTFITRQRTQHSKGFMMICADLNHTSQLDRGKFNKLVIRCLFPFLIVILLSYISPLQSSHLITLANNRLMFSLTQGATVLQRRLLEDSLLFTYGAYSVSLNSCRSSMKCH